MPNPTFNSILHGGCSCNFAEHKWWPRAIITLLVFPFLVCFFVRAQSTTPYQQTNIVSDGAVQAPMTDPNLLNPWGIALGQAFWIDANGSGQSLADDASGNKQLSVTIPAASSTSTKGSPTGVVLNTSSSAFMLSNGSSATFLFATLDGTVSGWNSAVSSKNIYSSSNTAIIAINNSSSGAVYTGLAILNSGGNTDLLLANYGKGTVDVYDQNFKPTTLSGSLTDPNLPASFVPYGIHVINNLIYVTYAQKASNTGQAVVGAGVGLVDVYDQNGNFMQEAIAHGNLNAPWGMALAPSGFGTFGGDLLVGNFGDGVINVYNPSTYAFIGQLKDASGNVIANPGLWEIVFGTSTLGNPNTLYFAAGLNQQKDGLFGSIAVATATASADYTFTSSTKSMTLQAGQSGTAKLTVAPMNGFSGTVNFSCSGLPTGASCSFSPSSVVLSAGASASTTVTVSTTGMGSGTVPYSRMSMLQSHPKGRDTINLVSLSVIFLLPIGIAGTLFRRKAGGRPDARVLLILILLAGSLGFAVGCGSYSSMGKTYTAPTTTTTPAATSTITMTATSGTASQSVMISLTVQ